jgi:tetratricopeptide (TPR) repeat protein
MGDFSSVPLDDDPFNLGPLNEEEGLHSLTRSLEMARGFSLLIARCNLPVERDRLIEVVKSRLPKFTIEHVRFDAPIKYLLFELRDRIGDRKPDAIFVSGLERSLTGAAPHHAPLIVAMNHSRDAYPRDIHCPLLLWLPDFALNALMRGARDFFSIRSGLYYFSAAPAETTELRRNVTSGAEYETFSMDVTEKRDRIASIESLLADYRTFPEDRRDYAGEDQLLYRLGLLYLSMGEMDKAEAAFRESLRACEKTGDVRSRAVTLGKIADIWEAQGRLEEALRIRQEEQLPVYERLNDVRSRAVTLGKIADIWEAQGRLEEALRIRQEEELPTFERLNDVRERAVTLGKIADIWQAQGRLEEALRIRQEEELPTFERLNDVRERAVTWARIADVLAARGELDEALRIRQEELLPTFERLGAVRERAVTLGKIADILAMQGRLEEALRFYKEILSVHRGMNDVHSMAHVLARIAQVLSAQGDFVTALDCLGHAEEIFTRLQSLHEIEWVRRMTQQFQRMQLATRRWRS